MADDRWFSQGIAAQYTMQNPPEQLQGFHPTEEVRHAQHFTEQDAGLLGRSGRSVRGAQSEMMRANATRGAEQTRADVQHAEEHRASLAQHFRALDASSARSRQDFMAFRESMLRRDQEHRAARKQTEEDMTLNLHETRQSIAKGKASVLAGVTAIDTSSRRIKYALDDMNDAILSLESHPDAFPTDRSAIFRSGASQQFRSAGSQLAPHQDLC